jgi:hypothetical protein
VVKSNDLNIMGSVQRRNHGCGRYKITAPCPIIYGFYDELAGCGKAMQDRPTGAKSVTLKEFENSSNLPKVEEREAYNSKIVPLHITLPQPIRGTWRVDG